jgi:hypothetical protein
MCGCACVAVRAAAVCGSAHTCLWQCARQRVAVHMVVCPQCAGQCASVRLVVYGSARCSVQILCEFIGIYVKIHGSINHFILFSIYVNLHEFVRIYANSCEVRFVCMNAHELK